MHLVNVNFLAVLTATVIQWILGWLWYGVLFKKDWTALAVKEGAIKINAGVVMALIFVANFILSFALAKIVALTGVTAFVYGALVGAICGLSFVVPPIFAQHISEGKPFKLFGINAVYWLLAMSLGGGVLAIWQ
jgi:hypothetical protein